MLCGHFYFPIFIPNFHKLYFYGVFTVVFWCFLCYGIIIKAQIKVIIELHYERRGIMTIQEMKERKKEYGYSYQQLSELSGVPVGTIQKIFSGTTTAPRRETICALERALTDPATVSGIREAQPAYQYTRQGEYTVEDYYQLPEDQWVELIDGVFYDMTAPMTYHQLIGGFIHSKLLSHALANKGPCLPMIAPVDVQLDCDNKTMVQPVVLILCDRDKLIDRCIYGAPDFIIEVISKSTGRKDCTIKLNKYMNAGVREYWMIDPIRLNILVYNFEEDTFPIIYSFNDVVPVSIWNGACSIDFKEVYEHIRFLYERNKKLEE